MYIIIDIISVFKKGFYLEDVLIMLIIIFIIYFLIII